MTLAGWQSGLGELVHQGSSGRGRNADAATSVDRRDLTLAERRWLLALPDAPGFALTCRITRWWRELKIRSTARLTCTQLSGEHGDHVLDYIDSDRFSSFFFVAEAVGFLDYVLARTHVPETARAIARFERALLLAGEAHEVADTAQGRASCDLSEDAQLMRSPEATLVMFDRPVESLLHALLEGRSVPPPERRGAYPVLVSPRLPHLWRPASRVEARLYRHLRSPVALAAALHRSRAGRQDARSLLADGIVEVIGDRAQG